MAHLPGTLEDVRGRVPAVLAAWEYMHENVLDGGLVDPDLKRLCFRYLAADGDMPIDERCAPRERLALRWAHAIVWDSDLADDALWEELHASFTEPELVELGCAIGFALGQQHFERTLGFRPHAGLS